MNKYIVTIKRDTVVIPITVKEPSMQLALDSVKGKYKFDSIINIEPAENYRKRNKENASFSAAIGKVKTSRKFLLG